MNYTSIFLIVACGVLSYGLTLNQEALNEERETKQSSIEEIEWKYLQKFNKHEAETHYNKCRDSMFENDMNLENCNNMTYVNSKFEDKHETCVSLASSTTSKAFSLLDCTFSQEFYNKLNNK